MQREKKLEETLDRETEAAIERELIAAGGGRGGGKWGRNSFEVSCGPPGGPQEISILSVCFFCGPPH